MKKDGGRRRWGPIALAWAEVSRLELFCRPPNSMERFLILMAFCTRRGSTGRWVIAKNAKKIKEAMIRRRAFAVRQLDLEPRVKSREEMQENFPLAFCAAQRLGGLSMTVIPACPGHGEDILIADRVFPGR